MLGFSAPLLPEVAFLGQSGSGLVGSTSLLDSVQNPSAALETTLEVWLHGQGVESKHVQLCLALILLLPPGVPAQERAPAKLIVYLQRFRPQDYQRLLEVHSSRENP